MINQIIDARREAIGVDLHSCELRAQRRQTLAEALTQCSNRALLRCAAVAADRGSTQAQRYG